MLFGRFAGLPRLRTTNLSKEALSVIESFAQSLRSLNSTGTLFRRPVTSFYESGGYTELIIREVAKKVYSKSDISLVYTQGRNSDFWEVSVSPSDVPAGTQPLKFAKAYGFRNIQTVINKIKRGRADWTYVEVMACPSGCVNGGGQIRSVALEREAVINEDSKTRISVVNRLLHDTDVLDLGSSRGEKRLWGGLEGEPKLRQRVLKTKYHAVPKMEDLNPMGIKW